jgi:nucleoside-diphosphate-sugar epimerase
VATYLVTGAAGFIGSNLVERLLIEGHAVRGLDNFLTGREENVRAAAGSARAGAFELITGDIRDPDMCARAVAGVDFVLHEAALPSVQRSVDDPVLSHDVNASGTLALLMAARDAKVKRFVYAASSSAYGDSPVLPKSETMTPSPRSPYAVAKLIGEHYCRVFSEVFGLRTISLRYFNVFGPRQDPTSHYAAVIPKFVTALLSGGRPVVYGDGEQSRDFTYIDNIVEANLRACRVDGVSGGVYNIACGERFSLNELLRVLCGVIGVETSADYQAPRPGDVRHSLADIELARRELGYEPTVGFREGLLRTVKHFKENAA